MTTEEAEAKWKSDIERAYGADARAARDLKTEASTSARASPAPPPSAEPPAVPATPPEIKHDVMAVPLVRLPSGICCLDWSGAHPA